MLEAKAWLVHGRHPDDTIYENWKKSFQLRKKEKGQSPVEQRDLIIEWPILGTAFGKALVDLDFVEMFPEKGLNLYNNWPVIHSKLTPFLKRNLKYPHLKEIFEKHYLIAGDVDKNYLMGCFLPGIIKSNFKIKSWKPSMEEVMESFIMHVEVYLFLLLLFLLILQNKLFSDCK